MDETIFDFLKPRWRITKKRLKELRIDPAKQWLEITLAELYNIAGELGITVSDLLRAYSNSVVDQYAAKAIVHLCAKHGIHPQQLTTTN